MVGDQRRRRADCRVVGLKTLQRLPLGRAREELAFQRIELLGDVVLAVEIILVEDVGEDFLSQDVLDQHLPHIGFRQHGIDGLLGMLQECRRRLAEAGMPS